MANYKYLIIGGGMAGDSALKGIREVDATATVGLIGAESQPPYNRPPLTKGLWKGEPEEKIWRQTDSLGADLHLGRRAEQLDAQNRQVTDDRGTAYGYEKLLLATGGTPKRLPGDPEGVIYYRTYRDYRTLRERAEDGERFTVVGSGFIGSEIAAALAMNGKHVTMIFRGDGVGDNALRFGVHAMDCLIGTIMKVGGDRRRLVAKVFGGARVLAIEGPLGDVPQRNIDFVSEFLETEGIPVLSSDVGGHHARHVHFHTGSGRAFVKRVLGTRARAIVEEQTRATVPPAYGSVTLFE